MLLISFIGQSDLFLNEGGECALAFTRSAGQLVMCQTPQQHSTKVLCFLPGSSFHHLPRHASPNAFGPPPCRMHATCLRPEHLPELVTGEGFRQRLAKHRELGAWVLRAHRRQVEAEEDQALLQRQSDRRQSTSHPTGPCSSAATSSASTAG